MTHVHLWVNRELHKFFSSLDINMAACGQMRGDALLTWLGRGHVVIVVDGAIIGVFLTWTE